MGENSDKGGVEVDGAVTSQLDVPTADAECPLAQMFEPPITLMILGELQLSGP